MVSTIAAIYALSIAVLTAYGVNLYWLSYRHARADRLIAGPVPEPDAMPDPPPHWPDVTIQLPLFNEPLVVDRLIDACAQIDYPSDRLEIQILDDSVDETTRIAADRAEYWRRHGMDVMHVRRPHRHGFKAGALANGLRLARGEFVAVFDADFLPDPGFLKSILPAFDNDRVGMAQARWGHLNADASWLTRAQAVGLDAHFAIEQRMRAETDCFLNFNGTAGVWRRSCIEDAGGWEADTIAEDLDLSYRAQLKGWLFRFVCDLTVPAELPSTSGGLRTQQFRWAKGSIETARKLFLDLWRAPEPLRRKLQGSIHMTAHAVFPFVLMAALLHAPLILANDRGLGPGEIYFGWMALGLIGFTGFSLAHVLAQRHLYVDWPRRLALLPVFMAGTIGLSVANTRAVLEALAGKRTPFIRTPKFGSSLDGSSPTFRTDAPTGGAGSLPTWRRISVVHALEAVMLVYSVAGLVVLAAAGEWAALPFQALFAVGFGLIVAATFASRGDGHIPSTVPN